MDLDFVKQVITLLLGAVATGIPLWFRIKRLEQKLKEGDQALKSGDIKLRVEETRAVHKDKINTEAEWKRIIEFRDAELVRLRERDDQQERQITVLWDKHVECQRSEAAQAEKIKAQNDKITSNEERIKTMETRLDELLKALITQKANNATH